MLFNTCRILPIIVILSSNDVRRKCKQGSPYRLVLFRNIKKEEYSCTSFAIYANCSKSICRMLNVLFAYDVLTMKRYVARYIIT